MTGGEDRLRMLAAVARTLPELSYEGWHFGDSVAFEAMLAADELLATGEYGAFVRGFLRGWASRVGQFRPLDCTAAGHAMVTAALRFDDSQILTVAVDLARYLTERRQVAGVYATWERSPLREPYGPVGLDAAAAALLADPGAGVFVDCLHFDPPFFAALGRATAERRWTDAAVLQATGYVDLLQDPTGLFHHFYLERTARRYVLGWGRGQGWALLGLLDVIESAPDHPGTPRLREAARTLIQAMLEHQRPDGHWDAVVGARNSGDETSTAAFMSVAFPRAAALAVVAPTQIEAASGAALHATMSSIDEAGVLTGVSAEVWACTEDQHYWHVPRGFVVAWGQGPAALALAQSLRPQVGVVGPMPAGPSSGIGLAP